MGKFMVCSRFVPVMFLFCSRFVLGSLFVHDLFFGCGNPLPPFCLTLLHGSVPLPPPDKTIFPLICFFTNNSAAGRRLPPGTPLQVPIPAEGYPGTQMGRI